MIGNDYELFAATPSMPRNGKVDSEVIFQLIDHNLTAAAKEGVKLTEDEAFDEITRALETVQGSMAVAWMDKYDPDGLYVAKGAQNPVCWMQTKAGSFIFASMRSTLQDAARQCNLVIACEGELDDGDLWRIDQGTIAACKTFMPDDGWSRSRQSYYSSGYSHAGGWSDAEYTQTDLPRRFPFTRASWHRDVDYVNVLAFERTTYVAHMAIDEYKELYDHRESAIDRYINLFPERGDGRWKHAGERHAFVLPGEHVSVQIAGVARFGQIVTMPSQFPGGDYVIRAWIPKDGISGESEIVLVGRHWSDFEVLRNADDAKDEQAIAEEIEAAAAVDRAADEALDELGQTTDQPPFEVSADGTVVTVNF